MTAVAHVVPLTCWAISQYQRHLSPLKGFRCAYRVLHGRDSCSQFALRAIGRHGMVAGTKLLRRRFERCRSASHALDYDRALRRRERRERGLWCVNGWNPGCNTADDVACCAGEGCLELPSILH